MADQLATPSDLASLLQSDLDTATATLLVEIGTAVVQNAAGGQRIVQVVDDVQQLDLDEHDAGLYLSLPQRPVTAVSAVSIGATALSAPADYTVQLSRSRIWRATGWRSALIGYYDQPSTVTVTYTHGYPAGHWKLQFGRGAVLGLIRSAYPNPSGANRVTIDDYTEAYDRVAAQLDASPNLRAALLRQYGRPVGSAKLITSG